MLSNISNQCISCVHSFAFWGLHSLSLGRQWKIWQSLSKTGLSIPHWYLSPEHTFHSDVKNRKCRNNLFTHNSFPPKALLFRLFLVSYCMRPSCQSWNIHLTHSMHNTHELYVNVHDAFRKLSQYVFVWTWYWSPIQYIMFYNEGVLTMLLEHIVQLNLPFVAICWK